MSSALDRQLNEEGMFLWLMRGVLKADAESDIIAQECALQTKVMQGKYLKQKQITNADAVNYLMRQGMHHISMPDIGSRKINRHDRVVC